MATPKYARITAFILDYIASNNLQQGDKLFTEKELCEKFNVSRITVQTALSDLQKDGVIYRVKKGGTFVGATNPNRLSAPPIADPQKIIPFVINHDAIASRTFDIISGAQEYLQSQSRYLTVHMANGSHETERELILSLINSNFKAIMVKPFYGNENVQFYFDLIKKGINIVFVDMLPNGITGNLVHSDNFMGGYLATNLLIENGYKKIAVLTYESDRGANAPKRILGYKHAHFEAKIPIKDEYICPLKSIDDGVIRNEIPQALDELLSLKEPPDAIFCTNDLIAFETFHALKRKDVLVPDDMALVGFDNGALSAKNAVGISTVEQDFHGIGYHAARLCCEADAGTLPGFTQLMLPVTLIARESSESGKRND